MSFTPACLVFTSPNAASQSFTASESGYAGTFTIDASSSCSQHPENSAAASTQPGGTCSFVVTDSAGNSGTFNVAISNTQVTGR